MKRCILLLFLLVSSQITRATDHSGSLVLSAPVAGICGGVTYLIIETVEDKLGFKTKKLGWFLINTTIATLVPGLLAADYNDNGKIDGSVIKDVCKGVALNEESLKRAGKILIFEKAGIINVLAAFVGVILADRMFGSEK